MLRQIGKRLATAIPSLIGVIIVTFLLTRVLPGDPAAYFAGRGTSINVPFPGSSNAWLEKEVELKHAFEEAFGRI